jgi:hypothetical protein
MQLTRIGLVYRLLLLPSIALTDYSTPSDDAFEALFVLLIDLVGELIPQVGARANEQDDHREEGLEVEEGRLYHHHAFMFLLLTMIVLFLINILL